jgi:cytochrome b561
MQIFDNNIRFGTISRVTHWIMALMLICLWVVGFSLANHFIPGESKKDVMNMHKSIGVIILFIAIFRLMWRILNKRSPDHKNYPKSSQILSVLNTWLFYALMFVFPISGIAMSLNGGRAISVFGMILINAPLGVNKALGKLSWNIHEICGKLFVISLALHIIGALYHQFILKDGIFKRMVGK